MRPSPQVLIAALVVVCLVPAGAQAKPVAAPAKKFLASQQPLRRAIEAKRPELTARADALTTAHAACVPRYRELMPLAGRKALEVWLDIGVYEGLDNAQESVSPVAADVEAHATRAAALSTGDKVLDRAARAQGRVLRWALALPELDTCAMVAEWRSHNFDVAYAPAAGDMLKDLTTVSRSTDRALREGKKRLRKLGLPRKAAAKALDFPLDTIPFASATEDSLETSGSGHGEVDLNVELTQP
jgi:hypothetical protein